jgi:hypothetical protein
MSHRTNRRNRAFIARATRAFVRVGSVLGMVVSLMGCVASETPVSPVPTGNAANADVLYVRAEQADDSTWAFEVTVEHPDTGWEDYEVVRQQ